MRASVWKHAAGVHTAGRELGTVEKYLLEKVTATGKHQQAQTPHRSRAQGQKIVGGS
jgi:hypothetical protein